MTIGYNPTVATPRRQVSGMLANFKSVTWIIAPQVGRTPAPRRDGDMKNDVGRCPEHLSNNATRSSWCSNIDTVISPALTLSQGWLIFWANFETLMGTSSQNSGPACEFWTNPVSFSFRPADLRAGVHCRHERRAAAARRADAARRSHGPPPCSSRGSPE